MTILCWGAAGWEKQRSKLLQIPGGKELRSLSDTYIQIHQNDLHLLAINKTHLAVYEWVPDFCASISHATYSGDGQTVYGTICVLDASVLKLHCQINPSAYLPQGLEPVVHGRGRKTALRSVEHNLNLDKLYVLGTNCVDNGTRKGLDKFLKAASSEPETVLHYEFMQNYKVHLKHLDGHIEEVPYFSLPANELVDVLLLLVIDVPEAIVNKIQGLCLILEKHCFDYTNGLADLVVGYMGMPKYSGISMTLHPQYVTVRNERGREMLSLVDNLLEVTPTTSSYSKHGQPFVMETVKAYDNAKLGKGPEPAPKFVGNVIAFLLNLVRTLSDAFKNYKIICKLLFYDLVLVEQIGPKGLEFARYSLDYHTIRNYLYVNRIWGKQRRNFQSDQHMPSYAKKIVDTYNKNGEIDRILSNK
ncbi:unnamed protein product [Prunus brigantina]